MVCFVADLLNALVVLPFRLESVLVLLYGP